MRSVGWVTDQLTPSTMSPVSQRDEFRMNSFHKGLNSLLQVYFLFRFSGHCTCGWDRSRQHLRYAHPMKLMQFAACVLQLLHSLGPPLSLQWLCSGCQSLMLAEWPLHTAATLNLRTIQSYTRISHPPNPLIRKRLIQDKNKPTWLVGHYRVFCAPAPCYSRPERTSGWRRGSQLHRIYSSYSRSPAPPRQSGYSGTCKTKIQKRMTKWAPLIYFTDI